MKSFSRPRSRSFFTLLAAGAAQIAALSSADAELVAGDSFVTGTGGYTANTNLTNQPGGATSPSSFGFSGVYGNSATGFLQPNTAGLNVTTTGYSGATGGSIRLVTGSAVPSGGSRSLTRALANSGANPDTLYFSGLLQAPSALTSDRGGFFEFSNRSQPTDGAAVLGIANEGFEFGIQGTSFVLRTAGGASAVETYTTSYAPLFGTTAATTNLFVLRLQINAAGDDLFTLYLNPTDVTSEATAQATAAFTIQLTDRDVAGSGADLSNFGFRTLSSGSATPNIFGDEVRIGKTFGDVVTGVPEPTTATLLLAGVGFLIGARRRRGARAGC